MFRNLRLYKLTSAWPESEQALSELLANGTFKPCASFAQRSLGWEPPAVELPGMLARRVAGADLLRLRHQVRLLPAAAIREALDDRLAEFLKRTGEPATAREKRELLEEVRARLLPQALLKSDRIHGFYAPAEHLLGIDTASATTAERFLDQLRLALGSLAVVPLEFSRPTRELLTQIFLGQGPEDFYAGQECRMQDPSIPGAYVNWMHIDLSDPLVRKHVREGLAVERLAIEYAATIGCTLDIDNVLRKVKLPGLDNDQAPPSANTPSTDAEGSDNRSGELETLAEFDATFAMLTGAVTQLVAALRKALAG
jgi:recombination associated protein RdgC